MSNERRTILTVFAGRKKNLNILTKYLDVALMKQLIDEVHFWNYARIKEDETYIKSISNIKRLSSTNHQFVELCTPIKNNQFNFSITSYENLQIKLIDNNNKEYKLKINHDGSSIFFDLSKDSCVHFDTPRVFDNMLTSKHIEIKFSGDKLIVYFDKNPYAVVYYTMEKMNPIQIQKVFIKVKYNNKDTTAGIISYETYQNNGYYFMDTCEKRTWHNYYNHYVNPEYQNDIIIKCDDDIVFMDINKLKNFIEYRRQSDCDLLFANIVNNGVAAFFQQNRYGLIPKRIMDLEYPLDGFCGSLWENGKKAELLHNYFILNHRKFTDFDFNNEIIDIPTRFSINFFAFKGMDWHKIKDCGIDDETILTTHYVRDKNFKNLLFSNFVVAHLSFYQQEKNMNSLLLTRQYSEFADFYLRHCLL